DTITFPDRKSIRSFGGILYNILPLALLAPEDFAISPVCNLGSDIYDKMITYLKRLKNVDLSGISRVGEKNNHVHLYYNEKWNKKEILENLVPKIEFHQVEPYLDSDYIQINFISGFDIELETLKKMREKTKARIFIDVHSLVLGIKKNGERFFKVPVLWKEYLRIADIVQMNFKEMQILSEKNLDSESKIKKFAKEILDLGPEILLVTCGREGVFIYYRKKRELICYRTSSLKLKDAVDPTGCGDVFSSGFVLAYHKTSNAELSSEFANFLAGMKSRFSGIEGFLEFHSEKYSS
ncbi:MAG: carbohydrate kinase family protein, partial [Candidatus Zixiibacteriota bacterium]